MWPLWVMITMMEMMKLWRRGDSLWNFFYKNMSLWRTKNTGLVKNQVSILKFIIIYQALQKCSRIKVHRKRCFWRPKKRTKLPGWGGRGSGDSGNAQKKTFFFSWCLPLLLESQVKPQSSALTQSPPWGSVRDFSLAISSAKIQESPPSPPRPLLLLVHLSPDLPLGHSHQLLLSCPA